MLEALFKRLKEIPMIFFKPIQKIIQDFDRLTLFMRDRLVSKTTNPLENYYRNTIPDSLKRIFKSPDGVLNYFEDRETILDWAHFKKYLTPKDFTPTYFRKD